MPDVLHFNYDHPDNKLRIEIKTTPDVILSVALKGAYYYPDVNKNRAILADVNLDLHVKDQKITLVFVPREVVNREFGSYANSNR